MKKICSLPYNIRIHLYSMNIYSILRISIIKMLVNILFGPMICIPSMTVIYLNIQMVMMNIS